MRKISALFLALALMMTLAVPAFAAVYDSGTVDFKDLKPGDTLVNGVTLTNTTGIYHVRCEYCKIAAIVKTNDVLEAVAIADKWKASGRHNGHFGSMSSGPDPKYLQNKLPTGNFTMTDLNGDVPKPQPKTGVMDTLPLWFGVMAVSACAYVLTSKKKVF